MAENRLDPAIAAPEPWFVRVRGRLSAMRDLRIRSTFLKNWLALSFSDLFGQILSFFAMFRVARHLSPEGYGTYALILATAALFSLIAGMGLGLVNVTEVAKNHSASRQVTRLTLQIRVLSTLVSIVLMMGYYVLIKHEQDQFVIAITAIMIVNSGLVDIFENLAFGRQVMRYTSLLNMANSVLWVFGLFLIPLSLLTVEVIVFYYVVLQVLRTAVYGVVEARQGFFRKAPEITGLNRTYLLRRGAPYYWMGLVGSSTTQMPVILLGLFVGNTQVGLFNAGNRLVAAIAIVFNGMSRSILPQFVKMRKESVERQERFLDMMLTAMLFVAACIALLVAATSKEIVLITVGPQYVAAIPSFANQIWVLTISALSILLGATLAAMEKQTLLAIVSTCNALIALGLVYVGARENAYALSSMLVVSGLLTLVLSFWAVEAQLKIKMSWQSILRNVMILLSGIFLSQLLVNVDALWMRLAVAGGAIAIWFLFSHRELQLAWSNMVQRKATISTRNDHDLGPVPL